MSWFKSTQEEGEKKSGLKAMAASVTSFSPQARMTWLLAKVCDIFPSESVCQRSISLSKTFFI